MTHGAVLQNETGPPFLEQTFIDCFYNKGFP